MIKVYSKDNCMQCVFTIKTLEDLGLDFEVTKMTTEDDFNWLRDNYGSGSMPIVEYNGVVVARGLEPDKLKELANEIKG